MTGLGSRIRQVGKSWQGELMRYLCAKGRGHQQTDRDSVGSSPARVMGVQGELYGPFDLTLHHIRASLMAQQ